VVGGLVGILSLHFHHIRLKILALTMGVITKIDMNERESLLIYLKHSGIHGMMMRLIHLTDKPASSMISPLLILSTLKANIFSQTLC
jgi:hypothetical protein